MANLETEVYELLIKAFWLIQVINMTKRLLFNSPSCSKLMILPLVSQFLTFLTTGLPIPLLLGKCHSEMKCFFVEWKQKCLLLLNLTWFSSCKCRELQAVQRCQQDKGFVRHLIGITLIYWPHVLQMQQNELSMAFTVKIQLIFLEQSSKIKLYQLQRASTGRNIKDNQLNINA